MDTSITLKEFALSQLNRDQQRAVRKLTVSSGGLLWWKVGTGKTRIGIFWFAMLQTMYKWEAPNICLCVVRRKSFDDWREEIKRMVPEADVYEDDLPAFPPSKHPSFLLLSDAMLAKNVEWLRRCPWIRCVILDEGWLYSNIKSAKTIAANKLTRGKHRLLMSGTAIKARDLVEAYAQAFAINKHKYIAPNMTRFRTEFQEIKSSKKFASWTAKPGAYNLFLEKTQEIADVHFPESRREICEQYHMVDATAEQKKLFSDLRKYYEIEADGLEYNSALAIGMKILQIANGFYTYREDPEDKSTEVIRTVPTNKLVKLKEEVEGILNSDDAATVVIWCAFLQDVSSIRYMLSKAKIATLQMTGSVKFDATAWARREARVCVATEASGSAVNYFAQTPYAIYYSANYKWKDMQQSRGRTDRESSTHDTCFYKYLAVRGSLDRRVYQIALGAGEEEEKFLQTAAMKDWLRS